ncbi:MAG TPA: DUF3592 domain-containing protein [Verrucomicrobiae bacterium]|nr:DUF3592 domain-containing protein [Verrucomicrobiae bacterium]
MAKYYKKPLSNRGSLILAAILISLFFGIVPVGTGVWAMIKNVQAEHWPITDGKIQTAQIVAHYGRHASVRYSPNVTYSYQVGDINLVGNKIAYVTYGGMSFSMRENAQIVLDRYPVGQKVSVHYSPDNPSDTVLETGIHSSVWDTLKIGSIFLGIGLVLLFLLFISWYNRPREI